MNELGLTAQFITTLLTADEEITALVADRIYRNHRPPNGGLPCIVFSLVSSIDKQAIGARQRLFTRPLYTIKAITEGTDDTVGDAIATRVDEVISGQSDFVGVGGLVKLGVYRTEAIEFVEPKDGKQYNHIGGQYRFFVHEV